MAGILTHLCEVGNGVGVVICAEVIQVGNIGIVRAILAPVAAADFVAPHMVQGFLLGAVLIDLPGKKMVERVGGVNAAVIARPGKHLHAVGGCHRSGGFIRPVKRAIDNIRGGVVTIGLLITL